MNIHCYECQGVRNHVVLNQRVRTTEYFAAYSDIEPVDGRVFRNNRYSIVSCQGCGEVRFVDEFGGLSYCAPGQEPNRSIPFETDSKPTIYPPNPKWHDRQLRHELRSIDDEEISSLLKEIYDAIHANCQRLALMGTRTVIEIMMNRSVGDHGTQKKTLKAFCENGKFGVTVHDALDHGLEIGNAAIHRGYQATNTQELYDILDNMENVLLEIYSRPKLIEKIKSVVERLPPRPKRQPE